MEEDEEYRGECEEQDADYMQKDRQEVIQTPESSEGRRTLHKSRALVQISEHQLVESLFHSFRVDRVVLLSSIAALLAAVRAACFAFLEKVHGTDYEASGLELLLTHIVGLSLNKGEF